jgi:hypothetical protein
MNRIRRRLVNFRVTDQEFERIKAASDNHGARCISEFARSVMLGGFQADGVPDPANASSLSERLLAFERRLDMIEVYVSHLGDGSRDRRGAYAYPKD